MADLTMYDDCSAYCVPNGLDQIMIDNQVTVWRMPDLYDARLLKGVYVAHSYPWHAHEEFGLNLVVDGAIQAQNRSRAAIGWAGTFTLANAEQMHRASAASPQGWSCRTLHILPEVIHNTAAELHSCRPASAIAFRGLVFDDSQLAREFLRLHRACEGPGSTLERQSLLLSVLALLLTRHAEKRLDITHRRREPRAVARVREYLDEHLSDKVTLDDLAAAAGIPPFSLIRAFKHAFGLTPHAYQLQARVRAAHAMIMRKAMALADVAGATGFADQAHLTRVYKSIMGATPGQFRRANMQ
jgi:AraC-like DNA-binding protein